MNEGSGDSVSEATAVKLIDVPEHSIIILDVIVQQEVVDLHDRRLIAHVALAPPEPAAVFGNRADPHACDSLTDPP